MEYALNPLSWLIGGALLILLEFLVPGLVVIFLGLGAIATAGMIYGGYIRDLYFAIVFFVLSSIFLLMSLRRMLLKAYPSLSERVETDEDVLIAGKTAITMTPISPDHFQGRVKYAGTSWAAKSLAGHIAANTMVEIISQENINLIVRQVN